MSSDIEHLSYNLATDLTLNLTFHRAKPVGCEFVSDEKVRAEHPIHATKTYYWKDPELGWLAADTHTQRESL